MTMPDRLRRRALPSLVSAIRATAILAIIILLTLANAWISMSVASGSVATMGWTTGSVRNLSKTHVVTVALVRTLQAASHVPVMMATSMMRPVALALRSMSVRKTPTHVVPMALVRTLQAASHVLATFVT